MSIPLDRLYHFIEDTAQHLAEDRVIIYRFYPHGSKNVENLLPLYRYNWSDTQLCASIYCNDQEPLDYNRYNHKSTQPTPPWPTVLPHFLKTFSIYEKVLLLHSEQRSRNLELYQQDQFVPVYWWSHALISRDWFRYAQHAVLKKQPITTFLIYNRAWSGTREYRLRFAELLAQTQLHRVSLSSIQSVDPELNTHYSQHQFKNTAWKPNLELEQYFRANTAPSHYSADFDLDDYSGTEIEVVLETLFDDDRLHLTEKSLRPIAMAQPFVLVATQGSLEYLRSYGFETFGTVWDESYDTVADPEQRLQAVVDVMQQIASWDETTRKTKIEQARQIADRNRTYFFSDVFFDRVVGELSHNLGLAFDQLEKVKDYKAWQDRWDSHLSNPEILSYVTTQYDRSLPNLECFNHIKSQISQARQNNRDCGLLLDSD